MLPKIFKTTPILATLAVASLCACSRAEPATASPDMSPVAYAQLYDAHGNLVGDAAFTPIDDGVSVDVRIYDLPPGLHGFHIHESGVCDGPDFKSAGDHFNPLGADHGLEDSDGAHLGDLPNLPVGTDRQAEGRLLVEGVDLEFVGARSLLAGDGTALVVHAKPDDYITDPAGAAGTRIACGVIETR